MSENDYWTGFRAGVEAAAKKADARSRKLVDDWKTGARVQVSFPKCWHQEGEIVASEIRALLPAVPEQSRTEIFQMEVAKAPPTGRSQVTLTDGSPVTPDHRDIKPNGQQKGYVVLSEAERAKGFMRPFRDAYRHTRCGQITTMGRSIAETYARDPHFYTSTFCTTCGTHYPVGEDGEFTWYEMDGTEGPKVGT